MTDKPQFILTDGGFVIQELGEDGYYHMVGRVAKRESDDSEGNRLVRLLNNGFAIEKAALPIKMQEWRAEAERLGEEAARSAATWVTNGNESDESRRRKLQRIEDEGYVPGEILLAPNLSGEFADSPTPQSLLRDIVGPDADPDLADELATAWEEGVEAEFEGAVTRELNRWVDR